METAVLFCIKRNLFRRCNTDVWLYSLQILFIMVIGLKLEINGSTIGIIIIQSEEEELGWENESEII